MVNILHIQRSYGHEKPQPRDGGDRRLQEAHTTVAYPLPWYYSYDEDFNKFLHETRT